MKPSESHKQPTFVIPKNPIQEVGFMGVIVCIILVFAVKYRVTSIVCNHGCLGNKWARRRKQQLNAISYPQETKEVQA